MKAPAVSLIVLTCNEEANLKECLDSASCFDDRHVLDSGSTDSTCEIARQCGAQLHTNPFHGFGQQRNWAIDNIPARHPWQLHLDADERLTPELIDEIFHAVASDPPVGGYHLPSKLMFAGSWLRHAGQYPAYQLRLFHRDRMRFIDHGHGQREQTTYPVARLKEPLLHYPFRKGLDHWFARHAVYARHEAEQTLQPDYTHSARFGYPRALFGSDSLQRRRVLKKWSSRLPCRYLARLFYMLFLQGAIFDGRAGWIYSRMLATYEAMIDVHLSLIRQGVTP